MSDLEKLDPGCRVRLETQISVMSAQVAAAAASRSRSGSRTLDTDGRTPSPDLSPALSRQRSEMEPPKSPGSDRGSRSQSPSAQRRRSSSPTSVASAAERQISELFGREALKQKMMGGEAKGDLVSEEMEKLIREETMEKGKVG